MTMTSPSRAGQSIERQAWIYRRLLLVFPREFRAEYGEDLVQGFRDLMVFTSDGRGVWWRTTRDLISSAVKQRSSMFSGERKPSPGLVFVLVVMLVAVILVGPGLFLPLVLLLIVVMIGLPVYGLSRFHRAWLVRRTTGGAIVKHVGLGVVAFLPAALLLVVLDNDAGYLIFVSVALTLIVGSAMGLIWAGVTVVSSRRQLLTDRRWLRPLLVLLPSIAILGFIIGASYNSYRQSLGPPGDHSVENASTDTRALWQAAYDGDVTEVIRVSTETCADPWVKFPIGNGRHNAKGQAETRELELPDELEPPFREISDILGDYMDDWHDRCGLSD